MTGRGGGGARSGRWRGDGRPAVAVLRSEDDFADPNLSRERRRLALFLLVHLVDEHGRMSTAYRRVLKRAARDQQHWAHGRSLGSVRAEVGRWIGVGARVGNLPPWDRIADLVDAVLDPVSAPDVLETARYLHSRALGEETAELPRRPRWLAVDHVTTSLIGGPEWARKHGLPVVELPEITPPEPADESADDPEWSSYHLLWSVVRVHRDAEASYQARITGLEEEIRALHQEIARLSGDVTSWLGSYVPTQERRTTDRHLASEAPAQAFTYPLPAELPASRRSG